ncbi:MULTISPECIES: hypothetical protein [unclassified Moorena]|nr:MULTISPECIES: hypothetical protein [unclassified Moorena]
MLTSFIEKQRLRYGHPWPVATLLEVGTVAWHRLRPIGPNP